MPINTTTEVRCDACDCLLEFRKDHKTVEVHDEWMTDNTGQVWCVWCIDSLSFNDKLGLDLL